MLLERDISNDVVDTILSTNRESVPELIADLCSRHELSRVMHELNQRILSNDRAARDSAREALDHLGFI